MILFENGVQGLSDTKYQGRLGSAHRVVGVDYRSEPGAITVNQKMTRETDTTVDELCKNVVPLPDGSKLWFSSESGKIWREVDGTYTLVHTNPTDPNPLVLGTDASKSYDYNAQINIPSDHFIKPDGTKLYTMGNAAVSGNSGEVFQYSLSTPWDVSTASYDVKTFAADINARGLFFKSDGLKMYVCEDQGSSTVIEYTLSTAWDVSTAAASGDTFDFSAQATRGYAINFNDDGTIMYITDINGNVYQYTLSIAWDITTASYASKSLASGLSLGLGGSSFSSDGTLLLMVASTGSGTAHFYTLSTAWDIATAVALSSWDITDSYSAYFGGFLFPDKSGFIVGAQSPPETVYQFDLVTETNPITLGAEYFDGYVYWSLPTMLRRTLLADVDDFSEPDTVALFFNGDDTYHPMRVQNNRLWIGDKYTIAYVDSNHNFTLTSDFGVTEEEQITDFIPYDTDLLIATKFPGRDHCRVLRWDTESESWYVQDDVWESEIWAFIPDDNITFIVAGSYLRLYYYDGEKMQSNRRVPGDYSNAATAKVNSNSVGLFRGVPIFGVSNDSGNPVWQGLYHLGRFSSDYNTTLDLAYPLSCERFDEIEVGAIVVDGTDIMVSWKSENDCGIDRIDWNNKYESAIIETMTLIPPSDRARFKAIDSIVLDYIELPTDCGVDIAREVNHSGQFIENEDPITDAKLQQIISKKTIPEIGNVRILYEFIVDDNNAPKIENFGINFEGQGKRTT